MSLDTLVNNSTIPQLLVSGSDVPFKGMLTLAQKQGDLYGIFFLSPRENFDSKLNELKPIFDDAIKQFNEQSTKALRGGDYTSSQFGKNEQKRRK
jgi:hypothetical protein